MKPKAWSIAVAALLLAPCALSHDVHDFESGETQETAVLDPPAFSDIVNITIPAECFVLGATVNVTGHPAGSDPTAYPSNAEVLLDGTVLWAFDGESYGDLGRQVVFSNGQAQSAFSFGPQGGSARSDVKLPRNAKIAAASLEVDCFGPGRLVQLANITGSVKNGQLGSSVSSAGDFNGDGYDDVLVGAYADSTGGVNAGRSFMFYGGPAMDLEPDLVFTGSAGDLLGYSVSEAGDLNCDGYDDIAIGAARCSAIANEAGRVLVYFGAKNPDTIADVVLNGSYNERFGASVSGIGDFNGDGYDDLAVGTDTTNLSGNPGWAYVFLGGPQMDNSSDLWLDGEAAGDNFGWPVAGAGDVNGDGFDDLLVGAILSDARAANGGSAYVFLGGPDPDGSAEITLRGKIANGWLGYSLSAAGDFDGDGYDDLIVGAPYDNTGGASSGAAYLLLGGAEPDGLPDLTFARAPYDRLGFSVSGAGDVNGDGFDDVIAGAPTNNTAGTDAGAAYIYFGGGLEGSADIVLLGSPGDNLGGTVSGAGNVNGDGLDDLLFGMPYSDLGGTNTGRAAIYSQGNFVSGPGLRIGSETVWEPQAVFAGKKVLPDLSAGLNRYLSKSVPSETDAFGNRMAEVPLEFFAGGEGNLTAAAMDIRYEGGTSLADFSRELNKFIGERKDEADAAGNLTIPLEIRAGSKGRLNLSGLDLKIDEAPVLVAPVPGLRLDEDTSESKLLDLRGHFRDDFDQPGALSFGVASVDPPGIVGVVVSDGYYLAADAFNGDVNDNWTGDLSVVVACSDSRGSERRSNLFTISVANVNDAPVVTSRPVTDSLAGLDYEYRLTATDAENDRYTFSLEAGPPGMFLDGSSGTLRWRPGDAGSFPVSVFVSDGSRRSYQNFTLFVSALNKPPRFTASPVTSATAGLPYLYEARASDPDGDRLEYALLVWPGGMAIGSGDGRIGWTPSRDISGEFPVAVSVSDGKGGQARQEFVIGVQPFVRPKVSITSPASGKTLSGKHIFAGAVLPGTLPVTGVSVRFDSGEWKAATGNATWGLLQDTRKLKNGPHLLEVRASDGATASDVTSVRFTVNNPVGADGTASVRVLGAVLVLIAVAGAGALINLRRRPRQPKKYDWGPD